MKRVLLCIVILNFFVITVNAVDDLEDDWHNGKMCISCHNSVLPESSYKKINYGCLCHYPPEDPVWYDKVDIRSVKNIHRSRPCIKCHVNSIAVSNKENLHTVHIDIECSNCHGGQEVVMPSYLDCFSCHESEIHGIHNIENLCIICHGKFGEDSIQKFRSSSVPVSTNISTIPEKNRFPTVIDFLRSLLSWFKLS
jgi:hypothetical protein